MAPQSTNAPFLDGAETFGADATIAQFTSAPFFDAGSGFAPVVTVGTPTAGLVVKVGATELTDSFDRSFRDELNGVGSWTISLANDDANMPDFGDVVVFEIDGVPRFAGPVGAKNIVTHGSGDHAAEVTRLSGYGRLAVTDRSLVRPSRGIDAEPTERTRSQSWASVDFPDVWPDSKRIRRADTPTPFVARAIPEWWPDKTAWWVWADRPDVSGTEAPFGRCLFRHSFTLGDDETVAILIGMNNAGYAYLDGRRIGDIANNPAEGTRLIIDLSAGTHVLAASVTNFIRDGGFICSTYTVDDDGLLDTLVSSSDADNVTCLGYPANVPGFTPGEAIRIILEESQAADELETVTLDFSDNVDSGGEAWSEVTEITCEVGRKVREYLEALSDWAADVHMAPGGDVLRAWNWGTRGSTPGITIAATTDPDTSEVEGLYHDGRDIRANHLMVAYRRGLTTVEDTTSITANGIIPDFVDLGDVETEEAAQRMGESLLELRKDESYASTLTLAPVSAQPYVDFDNGDYITHPDETGSTKSSRVRSIAVTENDEGVLTYVLELHDVRLETQERQDNWLKRFNMGSLAGGARVTSRSGKPPEPPTRVASKNVAEFSYDNVSLAASLSPKRPADSSGNLIEIRAELTTAGTTSTTVRVHKNGVQLGADLTFAAGVTDAEVDLEAEKTYRNVDIYQAEIVTAGTGAKGLDVQVRAI